MFNVGTQELLLILLAVLLLFGAKRIPEVARALGKGLGDFKDAMSGIERELKGEAPPASAGRPGSAAPGETTRPLDSAPGSPVPARGAAPELSPGTETSPEGAGAPAGGSPPPDVDPTPGEGRGLAG